MISCQERSQRFVAEKEKFNRKINNLTSSSSGNRQFFEAAATPSQVNYEVRTLKQTLEQKDHTIDQLKENAKALCSKQTLGSVVGNFTSRLWRSIKLTCCLTR